MSDEARVYSATIQRGPVTLATVGGILGGVAAVAAWLWVINRQLRSPCDESVGPIPKLAGHTCRCNLERTHRLPHTCNCGSWFEPAGTGCPS